MRLGKVVSAYHAASLDRPMYDWFARTPGLIEAIFDGLPDVLFYVKDREGRYLWANQTLIQRTGMSGLDAVVGRTADELCDYRRSSLG